MGIMGSEYRDRLAHWIRSLKQDFYTPEEEIRFSFCPAQGRQTLSEVRRQTFVPAEPGFAWGEEYGYGWFRAEFTLTEAAAGKPAVLDVQPGGEAALFVNGEAFGTYRAGWVKEPHHFLADNFLTEAGRAGDTFELYMEVYAGHDYARLPEEDCCTGPVFPGQYDWLGTETKRRRLGRSTWGVWDEDAYQLYMDVMTLAGLLEVLDPDSLRAAKVAEGLEAFTRIVDFEQDKEARTASYRRAREALRPLLEAENGSTMPLFSCVGNAHIDLAWLWPVEETRRKTARTFAAQLRLLERYPEYRFLQSQPAAYEMCRRDYPQLFEKIRQAAKEGRWIAEGAMWVEPDTNMAGGEALIRQLLYGKAYFKDMFGTESRLLWLPDTFGYSAALPQILKGCGVDYLVTQKIFWSYNDGEPFPYHYFTWRGMDGSEVVSFLPTSYTYGTNPEELNQVWKNRVQKRDLEEFLIPYGYGDGGGGPCRDHIEYLRRQEDLEGGVRTRQESPLEFFDRLQAAGGPAHTYTGELYFTAHRGTYTSQAAIKKWNRKTELALRDMDLWQSAALWLAKGETVLPSAEDLWKTLLFHQFHDILPGSCIGAVYRKAEAALKETWEAACARGRAAAEALLESTEGITVFNSLSFARTCLVELPEAYAAGCRTAEGEPVQVYQYGGKSCAWVSAPPLGAVSLLPDSGAGRGAEKLEAVCTVREEAGGGYVMENSCLRARLDEAGQVISFVRKPEEREFAAAPMNHFRLFKDVPRKFDAWDIDSNYLQQELEGVRQVRGEIRESSGPRAVVRFSGRIGNSSYVQDVVLEAGASRLEFHTEADWSETHRLWKASFPTVLRPETGINEIQFGFVERPMHRSRPYDQERFEVCSHRYSAVCDEGNGFALLNDCKYGIRMEDGALELTLLRAPASPDIRADRRSHSFTYAITAWEGPFLTCDVVKQAAELNEDPLVLQGSTRRFSLAAVDPDHVVLDTVKPAEDGSGDLILRLYECKKARCRARVRLGIPAERAWLCNMLEETEEEIPVTDGELCLEFGAFQIRTVRLRRGN